jgi:hypothetical protein
MGVPRLLRAAAVAALVVHGPVPRDRGGPAAEPVRVAAEPGQVARDVQPRFGGDVFGVLTDHGPQVTQEPGLDVPVEQPERLLIPGLGRLDGRREIRFVGHGGRRGPRRPPGRGGLRRFLLRGRRARYAPGGPARGFVVSRLRGARFPEAARTVRHGFSAVTYPCRIGQGHVCRSVHLVNDGASEALCAHVCTDLHQKPGHAPSAQHKRCSYLTTSVRPWSRLRCWSRK